jgi:hypothetical protein
MLASNRNKFVSFFDLKIPQTLPGWTCIYNVVKIAWTSQVRRMVLLS